MFNPFRRDGVSVDIHSLTLPDVELFLSTPNQEAIYFEFKETFDESVRAKLANVITSFANERGGWLLLGVSNESRQVVGVPAVDFDQVIGNILKSKSTPIPYYQLKLIGLPGVTNLLVVIAVPEGADAPYIVDGTAYRRIGSNSIGLQKIRDRYDFDSIAEKSKKRRKAFSRFCHPQVDVFDREWVPNRIAAGGYYRYYGVMSFYFILPDVQPDEGLWLESAETQERIKTVLNSNVIPVDSENQVSFQMPFPRYSFARNSLVFRNNAHDGPKDRTIIWQIDRNGWCKVHFPLPYLSPETIEELYLSERVAGSNGYVLDGKQILKGVFTILNLLVFCRKQLFPAHNRFILSMKVKNVRGDVVFVRDSPTFDRYFQSVPLPTVETRRFQTNSELVIDDLALNWIQSLGVLQNMAMAFNIPPEESIRIFLETITQRPAQT